MRTPWDGGEQFRHEVYFVQGPLVRQAGDEAGRVCARCSMVAGASRLTNARFGASSRESMVLPPDADRSGR